MAAIRFDQVSKLYPGPVRAVDGVSIDIRDGEFLVLVGPSGCGKSTLIRMLAGLESVSAGVISIDDRSVNDLPPEQRNTAMVFQNYALYPHMTVRGNLAFPLKMRKTPPAEARAKIDEVAELLELSPILDRKPAQLSGGQRQRVAMGRAIVRDPAVFLMDEPLSNLDAKLRTQIRADIASLQHRLGTTTIYVTHDQVEAMTLGHRICVMKQGAVQQIGPPGEVYERPANAFVAGFLGNPGMNLIPAGAVSAAPDRLELDLAGQSLAFESSAIPSGDRIGSNCLLGVRPEALTPVKPNSQEPQLRCTIEAVELIGHEQLAHLSLASSEMPSTPLAGSYTDKIIARIPSTVRLERGSAMWFGLSPDAIYIFENDGEKRSIDHRATESPPVES